MSYLRGRLGGKVKVLINIVLQLCCKAIVKFNKEASLSLPDTLPL
jgi:hypothetical protein